MDNREERRKILKENLLESIDYSRESSDEEIRELIDEMLVREGREIHFPCPSGAGSEESFSTRSASWMCCRSWWMIRGLRRLWSMAQTKFL